jgi:hypothetical protein
MPGEKIIVDGKVLKAGYLFFIFVEGDDPVDENKRIAVREDLLYFIDIPNGFRVIHLSTSRPLANNALSDVCGGNFGDFCDEFFNLFFTLGSFSGIAYFPFFVCKK